MDWIFIPSECGNIFEPFTLLLVFMRNKRENVHRLSQKMKSNLTEFLERIHLKIIYTSNKDVPKIYKFQLKHFPSLCTLEHE